MKTRTRERKIAFEVLFEHDLNNKPIEEILSSRREAGLTLPSAFGYTLVQGVVNNQSYLDNIITKYAENWRLERMPYCDRTILRIALFEIFYLSDVPIGVSINEAVELAKAYGTEDSSRFINGLLGRAVRDYFPETAHEKQGD